MQQTQVRYEYEYLVYANEHFIGISSLSLGKEEVVALRA